MNDDRPPRSEDSTERGAESGRTGGRLGQLIDLLDVGMLLLDAERRVDVVNRQASKILDLPLEAEEGWRELVEQLGEPLDALQSGEAKELRVDLHWRGDGEARWVTFELFSLEEAATIDGGGPCGFAVLVRDRSALRALEADLAIAAHLRNLSRLYVGLAHDLRSPMNALVLNLELLKQSLGEDAVPEAERQDKAREILETLRFELDRLSKALDGLLAQTLVPTQEVTRFDLGELVEEVAELIRAQARQEGAEVVTEPAGEPLPVEGNRDRIKRALLNLAINALEVLGSDRGTIELAARRREDRAELSISDSGPGIPAEVRERIFEMHFTTKDSGSGIGLFVARGAIEAAGGVLRLERTGPEGTVFVAELPIVEAE